MATRDIHFLVNNQRATDNDYRQDSMMFKSLEADTVGSKYIPFHAGFGSQVLSKDEKKVLLYNKYTPINRYVIGASYDRMYDMLSQGCYLRRWTPRGGTYFAMKGLILGYEPSTQDEHGNPLTIESYPTLMCLCIDKKYFWEINWENPDPEKFTLLVNNKFVESSHFKKVEREYIEDVKKAGIDVMYTNDIDSKCYRTAKEDIRFNTAEELNEYLRQFNSVVYEQPT